MLSQERKKSSVQIWVGISLIAALLGLAGGIGIASTVLDSSGNSGLESALRDSQARVTQLEAEVQDLQTDLEDRGSAYQVLAKEPDLLRWFLIHLQYRGDGMPVTAEKFAAGRSGPHLR